mmetsp:Transcript_15902/g.32251  ORF Transcript_15902/g.32251 Transcript_15902/m.32251 type:complete len:98 (+) Transcript_15902:289-582(+)
MDRVYAIGRKHSNTCINCDLCIHFANNSITPPFPFLYIGPPHSRDIPNLVSRAERRQKSGQTVKEKRRRRRERKGEVEKQREEKEGRGRKRRAFRRT